MKIETRAVHAGRHIDPATGAVTAPICLSTTFERSPEGEYPRGYSYSRDNNPNRRALEVCLADLEGGTETVAFSSGLAVATAVVQGLEPGDHILAPDDVYWGFRKVVGGVFERWPVEASYVDMTDLDAVRAAILGMTEGLLRDQVVAKRSECHADYTFDDIRKILEIMVPALGSEAVQPLKAVNR